MTGKHRVHDRKAQIYKLKPRCKACYNRRERGRRREWKRRYLQDWRRKNQQINRSYWDNDTQRQKQAARARAHYQANREAILIQKRMRSRGRKITLAEAKELLQRFGRCYPTRRGLTCRGLRETSALSCKNQTRLCAIIPL
jgi:hypothetical protein